MAGPLDPRCTGPTLAPCHCPPMRHAPSDSLYAPTQPLGLINTHSPFRPWPPVHTRLSPAPACAWPQPRPFSSLPPICSGPGHMVGETCPPEQTQALACMQLLSTHVSATPRARGLWGFRDVLPLCLCPPTPAHSTEAPESKDPSHCWISRTLWLLAIHSTTAHSTTHHP